MPLAQTALSPPPGGSRDAFTMDFHGNRWTRVLRLPLLCTRLTQRALLVVLVVLVVLVLVFVLVLFRTRAFNIECISTTMEPHCANDCAELSGSTTPGDSSTPRALDNQQMLAIDGFQKKSGNHVRVDGVRKMPKNAAKNPAQTHSTNSVDELI